MAKVTLIVGLAILAVAVAIGWQFASCELDNIELHDDLRDVAAQNGVNIGLNAPKTDEQIRNEVVSTAAEHGLHLQPDQVTLQKFASGLTVRYHLTVDYDAQVNLLLHTFTLHFTQSSEQ
jgi:hypothetical protein